MKTVFLTLALLAGSLFAKAQTTWVNMQNMNPFPVYYTLYAARCDNPQERITSLLEFMSPIGDNSIQTTTSVLWPGGTLPTGYGIVGMRVYSDAPSCATRTSMDVFAPVTGPLLPGSPLNTVCSGYPPISVIFEIYCSSPNNIFRFL